jgi:hypothetical protein
MTFNAHRRLMALDALRQLGVQTEGFGDFMEYEESVAPWSQRVALNLPGENTPADSKVTSSRATLGKRREFVVADLKVER